MTREEAEALTRFQHHCTCGGYAHSFNGRNPDNPHMSWCPQKPEYDEWRAALKRSPIERKTPIKRTAMKRTARKKGSKLTASARGQACQVRIPGHCNGNSETVVLAHLPGGGMGAKRLDIHGAYACSECHSVLDGHTKTDFAPEFLRLYHYDGVIRTQLLMLDAGLISL